MHVPNQYNTSLKSKMLDAGISQKDLAKKIGVPDSYISLSLHGKYNLSIQQQDRIAEILGCGVNEIF